jgi:SAM-dependent methyltransferase
MTAAAESQNPFADPSFVKGYEDWYSTLGQRADRLEKRLLAWLLDPFEHARTILEVGCGTGHFTRWFASRGMHPVALDISLPMLREARRLSLRSAVLGNAAHLPYGDGAVDLVAMITTLEFLEAPLAALHEARRVASKGIILGVINRVSWLGRSYRRQGGAPWTSARFYTPGELIRMLGALNGPTSAPFWRTTLWRFIPWSLPLPSGGFIGMGIKIKTQE